MKRTIKRNYKYSYTGLMYQTPSGDLYPSRDFTLSQVSRLTNSQICSISFLIGKFGSNENTNEGWEEIRVREVTEEQALSLRNRNTCQVNTLVV